LVIDAGLVGSTDLWEGYHESRRCSRDTYPESYITKYTSIRRKSSSFTPTSNPLHETPLQEIKQLNATKSMISQYQSQKSKAEGQDDLSGESKVLSSYLGG